MHEDYDNETTMTIIAFIVYCCGLSAGLFTTAINKAAQSASHSHREAITMGWVLGLIQGLAALVGGGIGSLVQYFFPQAGIYIVSFIIILVAYEMISSGFSKPDANFSLNTKTDIVKFVAFPFALGLDGLVMGLFLPWVDEGVLMGACYVAGAAFIAILMGSGLGGRTGRPAFGWIERIGGAMIMGSVIYTLIW